MKHTIYCWLLAVSCLLLAACREHSPKPAGYFRIDLPVSAYRTVKEGNMEFQLSNQASIVYPQEKQEAFFNIVYPAWNAQIYCSYIPIKKENILQLSEESRKFVYLHAVKADAIGEQIFENPEHDVYGIRYDIKGNVASPTQFILTDSVRSFFRGALYFDNTPNQDSILPVLDYINKDILVLIESFRWKE